MKDVSLLTWVTQLGLGVAFPLIGYILLAIWLRNKFHLGDWVVVVGVVVGILSAMSGLIQSMKAMDRLTKSKKDEPPAPVSFHEHE